jgi:hypothetical protein
MEDDDSDRPTLVAKISGKETNHDEKQQSTPVDETKIKVLGDITEKFEKEIQELKAQLARENVICSLFSQN